ncbi:MAG: 5-oxoprolinase/urea amidolyase family protein [Burkholderiaceae bacterium]|nr:5-oxoprolinase/urea amidolyase family protein [Burkholderiaceae bacterium]
MRLLPVNLDALMVELPGQAEVLALLDSLRRDPVPGVTELVPAARTLLVRVRPLECSLGRLAQILASRDLAAAGPPTGRLIDMAVRYDGEDLNEVARLLGIDAAEVVRRHTAQEWAVAFTGFAPGFAYLTADAGLAVPRRAVPRTRIPAGAVALAGGFSAVYPAASPGGWQLVGRTDATLWDLARDPPALLQPGDRVRFVDAGDRVRASSSAASASAGEGGYVRGARSRDALGAGQAALLVRSPGLFSTFQDHGRPGLAAQGVSASGALDPAALAAANRLVGNDGRCAAIESAGGGLQLQSVGPNVVAVTGARAALGLLSADGRRLQPAGHQAIALDDGDVLSLGAPVAGTRCYVAARGGFVHESVLGSAATDTLARLGPAPLAAGDVIGVRPAPPGAAVGLPEPEPPLAAPGEEVVLDVVPGPRADWFTPEALACLARQRWRVTAQSDRVGLRLEGDVPMARAVAGELPSEGTCRGSIQVPPSGQPVLFLADHPVTGGYPVIASVALHHLARAGQVPAGAWVRFRPLHAGALAAPASNL